MGEIAVLRPEFKSTEALSQDSASWETIDGDFAKAMGEICREALFGAREEVRNFVTPDGGE